LELGSSVRPLCTNIGNYNSPAAVHQKIWFQFCSEHYQKFAKVARGLLSAPMSNMSSERSFSLAVNTLAAHHSGLIPDSVDGLLFLHGSNRKKLQARLE